MVPLRLRLFVDETLACRDGVALAEEMGVQRVQVETDSQKLVKLWEVANISPVIREIRDRSAHF